MTKELSTNERDFIYNAMREGYRTDGRKFNESRRLVMNVDRATCSSRAEVTLGQTRVLAAVQAELVTPFPDHPTEGFFEYIRTDVTYGYRKIEKYWIFLRDVDGVETVARGESEGRKLD